MIMIDKKISDHFRGHEFRCPHCGNIKIDENLINKVEHIFNRVRASKCIVSSGYRCPKYDIAENGFAGRHSEGLAMDCCFYDKDNKLIPSKIIICVAYELGELNGIAKIDNYYVHLDNRVGSVYHGDETKGNSSYWNNPYDYFNVTLGDVKNYTGDTVKNITYQTHSIEDNKYYSNVKSGSSEYAGVFNKTMDGVLIDDLEYRVRVKGLIFNRWLSPVFGRSEYAGFYGHRITGITIKNAKYRVHIKGGNWLPWVTGYNIKDNINGYAGSSKGYEIDALQISEIMI